MEINAISQPLAFRSLVGFINCNNPLGRVKRVPPQNPDCPHSWHWFTGGLTPGTQLTDPNTLLPGFQHPANPGPNTNRVCKSNTTKCKHTQLQFKMATFVACSIFYFPIWFRKGSNAWVLSGVRKQMRGLGVFGRLAVWQTSLANFCLNGLTFLHV